MSIAETKELKKRVRDIIDPTRDLGHVDGKKKSVPSSTDKAVEAEQGGGKSEPEETREREGEAKGEAMGEAKGEAKGEAMEEAKGEVEVKGEIKRNPDGSICEECN